MTAPVLSPRPIAPQPASSARILIFTSVFAPQIGGAGMVPEAIARAYPEKVAVVASKRSPQGNELDDYTSFDARFPFSIFRISTFQGFVPLPPGKLRGLLTLLYNTLWIKPRTGRELLRVLAPVPFDVVCLNTIGSCYWLPKVLRKLNPQLKLIYYSHGEEWGRLMDTSGGRRSFRTIVEADAIVAVSSSTRGRVIASGIPAERVHLINNGVDTTRFLPGPAQPELLQRLGIRPDQQVILCLARLDERKGQDALIRALPLIHKDVPNAVVLLVGGGSDEPRLRAIVHELNLQTSVLFTGSVSDEDVLGWYRTADIYAMPNRTTEDGDTEGFGLVFLEAGACGLAVVGGNAGGVPDAVLDGETGFLVDGESIPAVAQACVRLLQDPVLRAAMGQRGLEHARSKSWPKQAGAFIELCDTVFHSAAAT